VLARFLETSSVAFLIFLARFNNSHSTASFSNSSGRQWGSEVDSEGATDDVEQTAHTG
jgi:hypothetical protein